MIPFLLPNYSCLDPASIEIKTEFFNDVDCHKKGAIESAQVTDFLKGSAPVHLSGQSSGHFVQPYMYLCQAKFTKMG